MRTLSLVKIFMGSALLIFAGFLISSQILAEPGHDPFDDIDYPISELGNCESEQACEVYCSDSNNMESCLNYAETHDLLSIEEIEIARRMMAIGGEGPGGCVGQIECEAYCDDFNNMEECIIFAEEHGLMTPEDLEEARQVLNAINQGIMPPNGCTSEQECDIYCSQLENMEECILFAIAAGLMPPDEVEEMENVLQAIRQGVRPPDCYSEEECNVFCAQPENTETCTAFFIAAGMMNPEEAEMFRKTGGKGPGDCQGEKCRDYCDNQDHMKECMEFALEYGLMSPEEAENARRMIEAGYTGGPGDCQGHEACEVYCNDPANIKECVDFAEAMGFMSSEDAERARKMAELGIIGGPGECQGEIECREFCENPDNIDTCIDFGVKIGDISSEEAEQMKQGMKMMQQGGPGGCQGEEECQEFCDDPGHVKECIMFSVEHGFMDSAQGERELRQLEMMETMMQEGDIQMMAPDDMIEMMDERFEEEMMGSFPEHEEMIEEFMSPPPSSEEIEEEAETQSLLEQIFKNVVSEIKEYLPAIAAIFSF